MSDLVAAGASLAGVIERQRIDDEDFDAGWRRCLDVNLSGALNMTRAFLPSLRAGRGSVVNLASVASFAVVNTSIAYATSKAAVAALTKSLAHELAKHEVRVNRRRSRAQFCSSPLHWQAT